MSSSAICGYFLCVAVVCFCKGQVLKITSVCDSSPVLDYGPTNTYSAVPSHSYSHFTLTPNVNQVTYFRCKLIGESALII